MHFGRLQQVIIAVAMMREMRQPMLTVDEQGAAASQRSSTHLENFNCRIGGENEILVGRNEYKNYDEGAAHDHAVGHDWNGRRCKNRSKVNPSANRRS